MREKLGASSVVTGNAAESLCLGVFLHIKNNGLELFYSLQIKKTMVYQFFMIAQNGYNPA